ncbi:TonB-dependent hemoglobin/transferrin/lactoferrin family receptor [Thalassotalea atypica]|uniref:TonB-dependent hemoglobin/transferrin/lactoferrin family receptor n=1 Tax=Thalassotalea atypica TaxID=2054316 RepID=UPI00257371E4|nr:TonB-dependent hemoglobin/transferrin/lactoferrin family receptor [Thalassotalea atypica]
MMFKPTPKVLACAVATALLTPIAHADVLDDAAIEGTAQDLEVIVVSGTRTEKALKDVAGSISVITVEDIEKQVVSDMSQLFKYDPSVQVTGKVGGAQNIIVRGMGGDRVLMIKDGMRMNEGYGADGLNDIVGRGFIDTDTIKQVEIAKGAASSLYGSDALGGIVVFTTKDASDYLDEGDTFAGKLKAGYNDVNRQYTIGGTLAFTTGQVEHLLNGSYRDGEEQQNFFDTESPFDIDSHSILYKGKYNISDTDFISFTADLYKQEAEGESANGLLAYFRGLEPYGYHIDTENSSNEKTSDAFKLRYHSETSTAFYDILNINVYSNVSEQKDGEYALLDINAPMFGVIEMRDMYKDSVYKQETVGFLSNASLQLNSMHTLGYGLDIESTDSKRHESKLYSVEGTPKPGYPQETDKFPKTETFRAGLFFNDEISLMNGQLTVTPGVRFDKYEMDPNGALKTNGEAFKKFNENHTSFNIAGLYKINDKLSAFAQYGQGFKVPAYDLAYIEHYNQASSTYIYEIVPSDDLSPEESDSYEIGLRGHIGNMAFSTAAFYSKYENFLSTVLIESNNVVDENGDFLYQHDKFQYQNLDAVTIKGLEFGMTYYLDNNVAIFANAAYQNGKDDETDDYITSISPLSGTAGINYEGEKFSTELIVNWADRMDKVNEGKKEIAGYASVDWLFNYELDAGLVFNLSVTNLLDKEYVRYSNAAGHDEDSALENLAEPGRSFAFNVNYSF